MNTYATLLGTVSFVALMGSAYGAPPSIPPTPPATITDGSHTVNSAVTVDFTSGCTVTVSGATADVACNGSGGSVSSIVAGANLTGGTITGTGTIALAGTISNETIAGPTLTGTITNSGTITGGSLGGTITNAGTISGGSLAGTITNAGTISGGSFAGTITNSGTLSGGTLTGSITNTSTLSALNVSG